MRELPPNSDDETTETDPGTGETNSKKSRPNSSAIPEATLQGKTVELDLRIKLDRDDALEQLDHIHRELGSPPEAGESETVTPEDDRALDALHAELDAQNARTHRDREELFGADSMVYRATEDAALELIRLVAAGFTKAELERIARSLADEIAKKYPHVESLASQEATLAYLKRRYEPYYKEVPDADDEDGDPTQITK